MLRNGRIAFAAYNYLPCVARDTTVCSRPPLVVKCASEDLPLLPDLKTQGMESNGQVPFNHTRYLSSTTNRQRISHSHDASRRSATVSSATPVARRCGCGDEDRRGWCDLMTTKWKACHPTCFFFLCISYFIVGVIIGNN